MSIFNYILEVLGLRFNPDRQGIACPYSGLEGSAPAVPKKKKPANLSYSKDGTPWLWGMDDSPGSMDWKRYDANTDDRTAIYTEYDAEVLEEWTNDPDRPNLKEENYRTLKPIYADGLSAVRAETDARNLNGPGYKSRTIDNYFSAMNKATARQMIDDGRLVETPTPAPERGRGAKGTRKKGHILQMS